jgi:hypothetical protein
MPIHPDLTSPLPSPRMSPTLFYESHPQSNAVPLSSIEPPSISSVSFAPAGVTHAATLGGTLLQVAGLNFGHIVNKTQVVVTVPAGSLVTTACELLVEDQLLQCELPPATGSISHVMVTVLGQTVSMAVTGLAYTPPRVTGVLPASWGSDLTSVVVLVNGAGFGSTALSSLVQVIVSASSTCPGTADVQLVEQTVNVRHDGQLTFLLQYQPPHVLPGWDMVVNVSGQLSSPLALLTNTPSLPVLTVERPSNGTHNFLVLSGTEYGPVVSTCSSDVTVSVGGQPCDALSMMEVCESV